MISIQSSNEIIEFIVSFESLVIQKMHRHANEAEMGLSSLANVTSLNDVLLTSPGDVFFQVVASSIFS